MIWLVFVALIAAVAVAIVWPLLHRAPAVAGDADPELAVHRDRLAELARERERGLLTDDEAHAAEIEIGRQMIAAARMAEAADAVATPRRGTAIVAAVSVTAVLGAGALATYVTVGAPGEPGRPFAAQPQQGVSAQIAGAHDGSEMAESLKRLAARLQKNPADRDGWILLARSYAATGKLAEAADAYRGAVTASPDDNDLRSAFGEALVKASGGLVTPEARAAFATVLVKRPKDPRSRYYLAVADAQAGKGREAIAALTALAADSGPDAPWMPAVNQQMAALAQRFGLKVETPKPAPPRAQQAAPQHPPAGPRGPTASDMAAAGAMSAGDRSQMIRTMVAQLAERLETNPADPAGWQRLARSYQVLGEPEKARSAIRRALDHIGLAPGDLQGSIRDQARALGVTADAPAAAAPAPAVPQNPGLARTLASVLESQPRNAAEWTQRGRALLVVGEMDKAVQAFAMGLAGEPRNMGLAMEYAEATLRAAPELSVARLPAPTGEALRTMLQVDGKNWQALWLLGLDAVAAGDVAGARDRWQRLLSAGTLSPAQQDAVRKRLAAAGAR